MPIARPSGKAALAVGALALTLVVGVTSGAVAGALITSSDIKDDTIKSRDIMDNAIQSRDIKSDTIRNSDIRAGAVNWDKSLDDETKAQLEALVSKGATGGIFFSTDDCRGTYEDLRRKGVEFTQEPTEQPYGVDAGFRDPSGNHLRMTQPASVTETA